MRCGRCTLSAIPFLLLPVTAMAQGAGCEGLLFSTSEDFTMQRAEGPDGNPVVSDGDLLAYNGATGVTTICRRNFDLLQVFQVGRIDLGLDAVAAIDREREFLVFSTELDDPKGQFTAGDLLFSTGLIVPNAALRARFDIRNDIGLDAVSLLGSRDGWRLFLEKLQGVPRDELQRNPEILIDVLREFEIDILFSTEGTAPSPRAPRFIDGDLLSAATGTIFRANATMLPALPAGIPVRGVDFGLDAWTFGTSPDPESNAPTELFSTEILGRADGTFTDGDALTTGPMIVLRNRDLTASLVPATFDLGLDALHLAPVETGCAAPELTQISNVDIGNIDAQGFARLLNPDFQPFGGFVRIEGAFPLALDCPNLGNFEFRVELDDGGGFPAIGDPNTLAVPTNWTRQLDGNPNPAIIDCITSAANPRTPWQPNANGWFNLADYRRFDECSDPASAAIWNSTALATTVEGGSPPVTVRFRLVMREVGAPAAYSVSPPVTVRLDNNGIALPASKDMPLTGDISMTLAASATTDATVDDCKINAGSQDVVLDLLGRVRDAHFWRYTLRWSGGNAVGWHGISPTEDSVFDNDGSDRPEISLAGTQPANDTAVLLSAFNLTAAHQAVTGGQAPIECGYTVELTGWDRTRVGSFNPNGGGFSTTFRRTQYPLSFCFEPS